MATPVLVMPARAKGPKLGPLSRRRRELVAPSPIAASPMVVPPIAIPSDEDTELPPRPILGAPSETIVSESPALPGPTPVPNGSRDTGSIGATAPRAILILESDLSIRKLLRRLLERRGHSIVEIEQPDALTTQLRRYHPGLLIIDISPAAEIGTTALVSIARANAGLKILALSSESLAFVEAGDEIATRLLALRKPFSLPAFLDCVDILLKSSAAATT